MTSVFPDVSGRTESLFEFLRGPDSLWRYLRGRWRLHRAARRYLRDVNRG